MEDRPGSSQSPEPREPSPDRSGQFRDLYKRFYPQIYRYFAARTEDRYVADELTNATFQMLWEHPERFAGPSALRSSLFYTASRLLAHHRRTLKRQRHLLVRLAGLADSRDETADGDTTENTAPLTAPGLSRQERAVLQLIYWDQLSHVEAAAVMQCSVNALTITLHRGRQKVAKHLGAISLEDAHPLAPSRVERRPRR